jgi:hypothetical protein
MHLFIISFCFDHLLYCFERQPFQLEVRVTYYKEPQVRTVLSEVGTVPGQSPLFLLFGK